MNNKKEKEYLDMKNKLMKLRKEIESKRSECSKKMRKAFEHKLKENEKNYTKDEFRIYALACFDWYNEVNKIAKEYFDDLYSYITKRWK